MQETARGRRRAVMAVLGAALAAGAATGCSSAAPEREYAVPGELCGITVSSDLLEPLLPPGKEIGPRPTSAVGVMRCRLVVDGETVFSSSVEQRGPDATARETAESAFGVGPGDASSGGGRFVYSRTGAVGLVECPEPAPADRSVWVTVRTEHASDASDLRRFIEAYADAAAGTDACEAP